MMLIEKIHAHTATVGVIGLGYVGLPLAIANLQVGFSVIGFDRDALKVAELAAGRSSIEDVSDDILARALAAGLALTTNMARLAECDVIVICVPTPLTPNREPDLGCIRSVVETVSEYLRQGQLVCLESTTYPGTTEEVVLPVLASRWLQVGVDFHLAFSPERVDPGNPIYSTRNTPRLVGGVTPACLEVARAFYLESIEQVIAVSSPRVAEMTKIFENTFRSVNIALVNELALLCDRMGVDVWEVVDAAATKPFGFMRFAPGPGVGGHCIPVDPFYLTWKAREYQFPTRFIELAGEINTQMPRFVREKVARALGEDVKVLKGSRILLLGVAYKRDIRDWRESPALQLFDLLEEAGALVGYHDPHVPVLRRNNREWHSLETLQSALKWADCTVIMTDHSCFDWPTILQASRRVVDTRNATRGLLSESGKVWRL